ncbi:MAG: hypothetical protein JWP22_1739 [Ramlibacter sp.]|nr:hypothetical protein [Ramlibacter sp.]
MNRPVRFFSAMLILLPLLANAQQAQYSPQNPPPVSFIFAGPVAQPLDGGGMEIKLRFALAVHSLEPDRIEVVDMATGQTLVSDSKPMLKATTLKIAANPALKIYQWEGVTTADPITESAPSWLHEKSDTRARLEARLFKEGALIFKWQQNAVYGYATKVAVLQALEYNRKVASPSK